MLSFFRKKSTEGNSLSSATMKSTNKNVANNGNSSSCKTIGKQSPSSSSVSSAESANGSDKDNIVRQLGYQDSKELKETIYDILRTIKDPEKPATLEDLNVVYEEGIFIQDPTENSVQVIRVEFNPTVPHCSLATLIGLCIRVKIERSIPHSLKLDIYIKKGAHSTEDEINKQINDKERIAAAMENPNLRNLVEECIKEED